MEFVFADSSDVETAKPILAERCLGDLQVDLHNRTLTAAVTGGADALRDLLMRLDDTDVKILDVGLRRPTLDDVFLTLTGHVAEEEPSPNEDGEAPPSRKRSREKEAVR